MHGSFWSWGLPAGTIAGVRLKIHWTLLLFWGYELDRVLKYELPFWVWPLAVTLSFLCILGHELGHCAAARAVGGSAHEIVMWPLGGLAFCHTPNHWRPKFAVAAGGPLVTLILLAGFFLLSLAVPAFSPFSEYRALNLSYRILVDWQLILLIFNLIPIYPLDGGRLFYAGAWALQQRFGKGYDSYYRATVATLWVSRIFCVAGGIYAVFSGSLFLLFIFFWS